MRNKFIAYGCLLLLGCRTGFAQTELLPPATPPPAFAGQRTDELKRTALDLLDRGRRMDLAVAQLDEVVRRDPQDIDARTFLGCALAGRAFVLARYLDDENKFFVGRIDYEMHQRQWKGAQEAQNSPLKDVAFPLPPIGRPAPLDGSSTALSDEQIAAAINALTERAKPYLGLKTDVVSKQADDAVPLSAEQRELRAWSELLLRIGPLGHSPASDYAVKPICDALQANLKVALEKDDSPRMKQSAGDAMVLSCNYPEFVPSMRSHKIHYKSDESVLEEGLHLLTEVAGTTTRGRAELWFFIGVNQPIFSTASTDPLAHFPDRIAAFKKAAHYNATNAIFPYTCAAELFVASFPDEEGDHPNVLSRDEQLLQDEAHSYLRSGSACTYLQHAQYRTAAPAAVRWAFRDLQTGNASDVATILGVLASDCHDRIKAQDFVGATGLANQAAQIGLLYFQAAATTDSSVGESTTCFAAGQFAMLMTAEMVRSIEAASPDKDVASGLDYCLAFASGTGPH